MEAVEVVEAVGGLSSSRIAVCFRSKAILTVIRVRSMDRFCPVRAPQRYWISVGSAPAEHPILTQWQFRHTLLYSIYVSRWSGGLASVQSGWSLYP